MSDKRKISELIPDYANANKGTERGRYALEASLRQYGAGRSILLDKNGRIIAGNKTVEVAADVGLDDVLIVQTDGTKIVAVQRTDLDIDSPEGRGLAYADNRVGELSLDWDAEQVLADLNAGMDLSALWKQDELDELIADLQPKGTEGDTEPQIARAEELRQKWGVEPGQLWQLGEHRLICGDCTDAATVARVMGGEILGGLITDPPYSSGGFTRGDRQSSTGKKYQYNADDLDVRYLDFAGDNKDQRSWITWCHLWLSIWLKSSREGSVIALFIDWRQLPALTDAIQSAGWLWRGIAVWDKTEAARPLYGRFRPQAEFVVWGSAGPLPMNDGSPAYAGVIRQGVESGNKMHLTQKPVPVGEWSLSMTKPGDIVADPFLGSGTTLIACENLGRRCRAVEIAPGYVAVALERWAVHTGKTPVIIPNGTT